MQHVDMVSTLAGISEIIFLFRACLLCGVNCLYCFTVKNKKYFCCKSVRHDCSFSASCWLSL